MHFISLKRHLDYIGHDLPIAKIAVKKKKKQGRNFRQSIVGNICLHTDFFKKTICSIINIDLKFNI